MRRTRRRVVASLLSLGVIASLVVSAPIARAERRDDADRIDHAIAYLAAQQRPNGSIPAFSPIGSTADAVLAFVAAGVGEEQLADALGFLRRRVAHGKADGVGITAKIVTAVVAGGGDPHAFGGVDLVQSLVDTLGPHGRFGTASVFDDALAVLALEAAGSRCPTHSIQWLVDAQCADGGWQYSKPASANDDEHCLSTGASDEGLLRVRHEHDVVRRCRRSTRREAPRSRPIRSRSSTRSATGSGTAGDTRGASRRPTRTRPRW